MSCPKNRVLANELARARYAASESIRSAAAARYAKNREHKKDLARRYRIEHPDKVKAMNQSHRAKNKAKISARDKIYREKNLEKRRIQFVAWKAKNAERIKSDAAKRYRHLAETRPEIFRAQENKRRAAKRASIGSHTAEDIKTLLCRQKGRCVACPTSLKHGYHVDHITPLSKGGSNDKTNLQLLCPTCNLQKGKFDPIIFMQRKGFLL